MEEKSVWKQKSDRASSSARVLAHWAQKVARQLRAAAQ